MRSGSATHWSVSPALLLAGAFAIGVVLGGGGDIGGIEVWLSGVAVGGLAFCAVEWHDRHRLVSLAPLGRVLAVGLVGISAGGLRHAVYETASPRALTRVAAGLQDETISLGGTVDGAPEHSGAESRFSVAVDTIYGPQAVGVDGRVRVTLRPPPWKDRRGAFPRVRQGDQVRLRGDLRPAPGQRNPGGFNYAAYLERRGICCVMYVGDPADVDIHERVRGVMGAITATRAYVRRALNRYVGSDGGRAVLQALLLGDRGEITDAQREHFARTGLMHLLAVSGLHVFLVGMVVYGVLRPVLIRLGLQWRAMELGRAVFTVGLLGGYMVLTGMRPSVVRAVVMAGLFIGGILLQRPSRPLNTLAVAALILLGVRPVALYDVGFQLSMAAVTGILVLLPRLERIVPARWRRSTVGDGLVSTVAASGAAILGTGPVLLYHFGWVSGAGLLLNTLGIPFTGLALSAALATVGSAGISSTVAATFGAAADFFVQGLLVTSREGAVWLSWMGIRMSEPDWLVLLAALSGLCAVGWWEWPRTRWRCLVGMLFLLVVSVWGEVTGGGPTLDAIFFDVGHGDAVLISTPHGRHLLVDTGPRSPVGSAMAYAVLPYLEKHGVRRLDAVLVTHPDADHLGGLPTLLRERSVERVLHGGRAADTDLYRESWELLDEGGIPTRRVNRGDTVSLGAGVRLEVLGPSPSRRSGTKNDASVVIRLEYGKVDVLLTGDIEGTAERGLINGFGWRLRGDLVKVPHHGSETSSTRAFVEAATDTSETHAVVSAGNRYGGAAEEVMARWDDCAEHVHRTSSRGAVWMRTDGRDVWRVRWK